MNTEAEPQHQSSSHTIHLPAPTAWPITLAFGLTFLCMGIVTYWLISAMGAALTIISIIGWFRDVLPSERHIDVRVTTEVVEVKSSRTQVAHLPAPNGRHRQIVPLERYTPIVGIQGGLAGAVAMAIPALIYGQLYLHSIWYAPNLLAAMALPNWASQSTAFLTAFHLDGLLVAVGIHLFASILMGILYGSVLPMYPKRPILNAGFVAPLFWTGLLTLGLSAVNPLLLHRINWLWFILSQIAFGLVAGFVVNLHVPVRTPQFLTRPFYERAGLISQPLEEGSSELGQEKQVQPDKDASE